MYRTSLSNVGHILGTSITDKQDVISIAYQSQVQGNGNVVVFPAIADGRALPPIITAIYGIADWVCRSYLLQSTSSSPGITAVAVTYLGHKIHMLN